ncbi:MAG: geranylgeranylglycerol-phosphate geranylgeranyltransferase [Bacteroidales bacterium]
MVNILAHIMAVLRMIRISNLLIVIVTQVLVRQCLIVPLLKQVHMEPQLPPVSFVFLILATVFITAGGYAINDYFDRKIDRVNKPGEQIVGTLIYPRHAMAYHLVFTILGVILGTWVALKAGELYLSLVFFIVSGLLWFYSTSYKHELLLGNVMVALLTSLVPFIVLLFELPLLARNYGANINYILPVLMKWVLGFSLFAFLVNLIREIVKDAEDFEGDQAYGKKTIPVVWGVRTAKSISLVLIALTIALFVIAWVNYVPDYTSLIYFIAFIITPLIVTGILLFRGADSQVYRKASLLLKLVMLTGLGYMVIVNLLINNMK